MRIIAMSGLCLLASVGFVAARGADQIPAQFTNLQVFPKDIARAELINAMKQFCFDLDVRCQHCHVGEGDDLSTFDFASDARPAKATARRMLRMVTAINGEHLRGVGTPSDQPKVTCFTCHRESTKPLTRAGGGVRW
jgi:hypothetical protein